MAMHINTITIPQCCSEPMFVKDYEQSIPCGIRLLCIRCNSRIVIEAKPGVGNNEIVGVQWEEFPLPTSEGQMLVEEFTHGDLPTIPFAALAAYTLTSEFREAAELEANTCISAGGAFYGPDAIIKNQDDPPELDRLLDDGGKDVEPDHIPGGWAGD